MSLYAAPCCVDRDTIRNVALAVCGGLAVALTAAMLPAAFRPERGGEGGSGGVGSGDGVGEPPARPPADPPEMVIDIPFLPELLTALAVVAALLALRYLYHNRRRVFRAAVVALAIALVGAVISQFFAPDPSTVQPPSFEPAPTNASDGGASGETVSDPPALALVFVLVLTAAVLGTAFAVRRRSRGDREASSDDADAGSGEAAAMARAAGRAADRIEEGDDVDNEVYRAWREMTSLLDLARPETNTAGEFESAAVEAGMDPADVRELTALFETARYGGYEPEPTDERRAVELLRRIEDRYSEGES